MSNEVVPRVGQVGTVFTVTVKEPDVNNPGPPQQYIPIDLTTENGLCSIQFQRPDKSKFEVTGIALAPKTSGKIQVTDTTGVLNQAGLWRLRGIARFIGNPVIVFPGSWTYQRVGN